ncbi:MAG: hypothetical protein V4714_08120 [Bacteroidota bacterium]
MQKTILAALRGGLALSCLLTAMSGCNSDKELQEVAPKNASTVQAGARATSFDFNLALRWAPVHLQDVDATGKYALGGKSDYITNITFDNDWVATNNWNNAGTNLLKAHSYFSVVETSTHWFVIYAFYHPRDWTDVFFLYELDQHENDLEGYLSVIKKDGSTYGSLQGIVTVAHSDFYSFLPQGSPLQENQEDIDGTLSFETYNGNPHPLTAQEAKGHGLKAFPYNNINGDGIKYYPSSAYVAEQPENGNDRFVAYKLVDIFEPNGLWEQRFNTNLFSSPEGGIKSTVGSGGANAPWAWDDGDDVPGKGELATDPARLVNSYFKNLGNFDLNYTRNLYRGIGN